MKYLVWDLDQSFEPIECNQLRLYEENRHGDGGVLILGGSFDGADDPPTLFDTREEAEEAVERTNNWFFDDCGDPEMFRCTIIEVQKQWAEEKV